ncbi:PREDICTED: uncharacterized protein LOC106813848 [Priapulus caudatus]|uniref:Uncharacterized protein LOC106813848 n=1 Tax=Priapulus caudatus TaxID=37621 RepID=A0ABM1EMZ8_PRICU|nr:PREDICTED: uncharacterized protein LOC106813848 [Priapulus caudatus]XP_014673568.1 PREDICTED: uncharacterized protein LOC106813848 [Priapulus caudatus]XP_014673569.1 PREDICTED: uncharacterized protein LOC106813848 [Priapulus caudatus]
MASCRASTRPSPAAARRVTKFAEDGSVNAAAVEARLDQCLKQLDQLCDTSDHSQVVLRADTNSLRDNIRGFGAIETRRQGAPSSLPGAAALTSQCLPSSLEEYEDLDHHLMHKPVADPFNIVVAFPKLSGRRDDWLTSSGTATPTTDGAKPWPPSSGATTPSAAAPRPPQHLNIPQRHLELGGKDTPVSALSEDSALSIQHWLQQIKTETEAEPTVYDDFEVIPWGASASAAATSSSGEESLFGVLEAPDTPRYFKRVLESPSSRWLVAVATEVSPSATYQRLQYFVKVTDNWDKWLSRKSKKRQDSEEGGTASPAATDGEMLFPYFQQISSSVEGWLYNPRLTEKLVNAVRRASQHSGAPSPPPPTPTNRSHGDGDELGHFRRVRAASRSDWLKKFSAGEAVAAGSRKRASPFAHFERVSKDPSDWLKKNGQEAPASPDGASPFAHFERISKDPSDWLKECVGAAMPDRVASPPPLFRHVSANAGDWLRRDSDGESVPFEFVYPPAASDVTKLCPLVAADSPSSSPGVVSAWLRVEDPLGAHAMAPSSQPAVAAATAEFHPFPLGTHVVAATVQSAAAAAAVTADLNPFQQPLNVQEWCKVAATQ